MTPTSWHPWPRPIGSWWDGDRFVEGQWQPKGHTDRGAPEAVVDKISLEQLSQLGPEVFELVIETSLADNTRRVLAEHADTSPT